MGDMQPNRDRPPITWSDLKVFTDETTGLAVRLQISDSQRPQYSMQLGRLGREARFAPFLRPEILVQGGQVSLKSLDMATLGRLVAEAEKLIYEKTQERENAWQAQHHSRDERGGGGGPGRGEPRRTGKTQRDRDKRRRDDRDDRW